MLYPMLALMFLTLCVAINLLVQRIKAVRHQKLKLGYFRVNTGAEPPPKVLAAANHYSNLFEVPVLFYLACITALVVDAQSPLLVSFAWAFVALRLIHTVIHLSYNNVIHRLAAFLLSVIALVGTWILITLHYQALI